MPEMLEKHQESLRGWSKGKKVLGSRRWDWRSNGVRLCRASWATGKTQVYTVSEAESTRRFATVEWRALTYRFNSSLWWPAESRPKKGQSRRREGGKGNRVRIVHGIMGVWTRKPMAEKCPHFGSPGCSHQEKTVKRNVWNRTWRSWCGLTRQKRQGFTFPFSEYLFPENTETLMMSQPTRWEWLSKVHSPCGIGPTEGKKLSKGNYSSSHSFPPPSHLLHLKLPASSWRLLFLD